VPRVFDHVTIRASDRGASEQFYATVLAPLGIARTYTADDLAEWDDFSLASADADNPVTRRLHIAWLAPSRELVDEFWRVGTSAGYRDDGAPGERPQYSPDYYGAFLLDPDGNSAEAVHHGEPHTPATSTTSGSGSPTSPPRGGSTLRSARTRASRSATRRPTASRWSAAAPHSRSSPARRSPSTSTWRPGAGERHGAGVPPHRARRRLPRQRRPG
jgi:catechol 2,3-dioxygenase-like lactoylglutathione lyase family enzyme